MSKKIRTREEMKIIRMQVEDLAALNIRSSDIARVLSINRSQAVKIKSEIKARRKFDEWPENIWFEDAITNDHLGRRF